MHKSHAKLTGHMALTLLGPDGQPMARYENHNTVVPTGQTLLLNLLQGSFSAKAITPVLATAEFDTAKEDPANQDGAIKLTSMTLENSRIADGNRLVMQFRGNAAKAGKVNGGGLVVTAVDSSGQEVPTLYNHARISNEVDVQRGLPMLVNFNLTVG